MTGAVSAGILLTRSGGAPLAAASGGAPASTFSDVQPGTEGLDSMVWADSTRVLPALEDGTYAPDSPVARGDIAVALHRFAGTPEVPLEGTPVLIVDLGDVPERASALLWLHGRGALWGDAELKVHPEDPATRDCAAALLTALLRPALAGVGATWDPSTDAALSQDAEPGSSRADAVWLQQAGMAPASFTVEAWSGESIVTRAELAGALHRANAVIVDALG